MINKPLTTKQAKAAYKKRGQTGISDTERRRLTRGAELIARADRLKEQDRRKKELTEKRKELESKKHDSPGVLLGTQVQLDKFGYKSSQFHLGAFIKPAPALWRSTDSGIGLSEPWDDDEAEDFDESLLSEAVETLPSDLPLNHARDNGTVGANESANISDLESFLDSSTQLARELEGNQEQERISRPPSSDQWPSFSSDDFGITEDEWQQLETKIEPTISSECKATTVGTGLPQPESNSQKDRRRMPPPPPSNLLPPQEIVKPLSTTPRPPLQHSTSNTMLPPPRPQPQNAGPGFKILSVPQKAPLPPKTSTSGRTTMPPPMVSKRQTIFYKGGPAPLPPPATHGLSAADLEALASDEILLSQFIG